VSRVVARLTTVLVAVLVLAWLGLMERNARLQEQGIAASGRLDVQGNAARAESAFRRARTLNPDTAPDVGRALLYLALERRDEATSLLAAVLRREPENLTAWGVLFNVARDRDPATAERAAAALRRLDPVRARAG
jgi:predicted Zn-dependent protease